MTDNIAFSPRVWVLTDGKVGDDVQCLAVAAALAPDFEKRVIAPRAPWSWFAPWGPIDPRDAPVNEASPVHGTLPDIIIASGRRAIPYACALKRRSAGRTKIVILKDPRFRRSVADVIWAPAHDRLEGANVFSTLTSPHMLSEKIADRKSNMTLPAATFEKPLLGVLLGGPSGGAQYNEQEAAGLAGQLNIAGKQYQTVAITPSRRTPNSFIGALRERLTLDDVYIWDRSDNNPYIDILAEADALIVAADSHNMMSEALAAGVGVYVWRPAGLAPKMAQFICQLEEEGAVRFLDAEAAPFENKPVDATPEIVAELKKRLCLA